MPFPAASTRCPEMGRHVLTSSWEAGREPAVGWRGGSGLLGGLATVSGRRYTRPIRNTEAVLLEGRLAAMQVRWRSLLMT